jgi:hypothetical protein
LYLGLSFFELSFHFGKNAELRIKISCPDSGLLVVVR